MSSVGPRLLGAIQSQYGGRHPDGQCQGFAAMTEWGPMTAKKRNIQREFQELQWSAVDMVYRHNYQLEQGFTQKPRGGAGATGWREKALEGCAWAAEERFLSRLRPQSILGWKPERKGLIELWQENRCMYSLAASVAITRFIFPRLVQPDVEVGLSKKGPLMQPQPARLPDFHPGHIQVCWFLNRQEEIAGVVSTNMVIVETGRSRPGDAGNEPPAGRCLHMPRGTSRPGQDEAQLDSAKSKILARVGTLYWGSGPSQQASPSTLEASEVRNSWKVVDIAFAVSRSPILQLLILLTSSNLPPPRGALRQHQAPDTNISESGNKCSSSRGNSLEGKEEALGLEALHPRLLRPLWREWGS
ncbi:LOW QUALITY PROTEIN: hypothetical protein MC885_003598, partial [Smutsia gigantea]